MTRRPRTILSLITGVVMAVPLAVTAVPATAVEGEAAGPLRFDFGSATSPVAEGYTQVANTTLYTPERGYGLSKETAFRDRGGPDDARRDFTIDADYRFSADITNGVYFVQAVAGDDIAFNRTGFTIEGTNFGTISSPSGQFATLSETVTVADGRLDIDLRSNGRLNALTVTRLATPTDLAVTGTTLGADPTVTLSWAEAEGAEAYRLYRAPQGEDTFSVVAEGTATEVTDDTVDLGASYDYAVTALVGGDIESPRSETVTVDVRDPNAPTPAAPAELRLVSATEQERTLEWAAVDGAVLYSVERSFTAEGGFEQIAQTTAPRYVDADEPARTAYYRVLAVSNGGGSGVSATVAAPATVVSLRQVEDLDRGVVAVPTDDGVLVSWRLLGTDPSRTAFDVLRGGTQVNEQPLTDATSFVDPEGTAGAAYTVRTLVDGVVTEESASAAAWDNAYRDIPLDKPADGVTPDGVAYSYRANDASVADLDGDGQLEIVLKWDPTNSQDNSRPGYTGEVFFDAYELDGTKLWRISMGDNIRAGAHYSQFLVYDFDGTGGAEVVVKTADGTTDGLGNVIGDADADYRNDGGYVLDGPEFLTIFAGDTGAELTTTEYYPPRGDVCDWGDCYGNRVDRFLAGVAFLDGENPSIVMARGYYTRSVLAAYDFTGGELERRWVFDSDEEGLGGYAGQGNHQLSVADIDGDQRDEIVYGAMAVDDDGTGLYTTGLGHGDAMHLSDFDPARPGLEVFQVHEDSGAALGIEFRDADSGEAIWGERTGSDTGRGLAGDIDPRHPGAEAWAIAGEWNSRTGGLFTATGEKISDVIPPANFGIWWDGDLGREILDHDFEVESRTGVGRIDDWNWETGKLDNLLIAEGTLSNNDTKGNPVLQADILGDWREEVIWRTDDSTALRLYATPHATEHRMPTLMHDPVYRLGVAWQNVGYNQPPWTSYFLGFDMEQAPLPMVTTGDVTETTMKVAPDEWHVGDAQGPKTVRARIDLPEGLSADAVAAAGARLLIDGTVVEAELTAEGGQDALTVLIGGEQVRAAAGEFRGEVTLSLVAPLEDGGALLARGTVTLLE